MYDPWFAKNFEKRRKKYLKFQNIVIVIFIMVFVFLVPYLFFIRFSCISGNRDACAFCSSWDETCVRMKVANRIAERDIN